MKELMFFDRCFWCLEDFFANMEGVLATEVGYANGDPAIIPEYYEVGKGKTGYEEVARVIFDEEVIPLPEICRRFFKKLNPKKEYSAEEKLLRENQSKIIFVDFRDEEEIRRVKQAVTAEYGDHLLTQIEPLQRYFRAEEEHQHYFKKHPEEAVCAL